jgi:hypothetical protein
MYRVHVRQAAVLGLVAALGVGLLTPFAGSAEEPAIAPAPAVLPGSGHIMGSGGLGSPQEEMIVMAVEGVPVGVQTGGYTTIDATLAARLAAGSAREETTIVLAPTDFTNQVAGDVRWAPAPWDDTSGYGALEASRATIGTTR